MRIRLIEGPLAVPRYRQVRLPTVAAELAPYADVEINDPNIEPLNSSRVDLVGFTAQAYNAQRAIYLAKRFREMGVKTIVGGPYPTAMRERALQHFDAAVVGEVEGLGEKICRDLERGQLRGMYTNEMPPDLGTARLPRRDLQRSDKYYRINFPIELSRGCPHRCAFCYNPIGFPSFRVRPLELIARDLDQWDYGYIEAVDMHFAANREHLLQVCRLFEERKIWGWFGQATLMSLDDVEVLRGLERSNCRQVFVGIESIDETALALTNKQFNKVQDYRRIIRMAQDHGVLIHAGFIWGLDGATPESFDATAQFCDQTGIYLASTNMVTFFPGLPAHSQAQTQGRLLATDDRDYDSTRVTIQPLGMTPEQVYAGARRFLDHFYSCESIFRRSFQNANFRLSQLWGFWGFNLAYRAYFRVWGRHLGVRQTPWRANAAERDSFPYVGGRMPFIYDLGHGESRVLTALHRAWEKEPSAASKTWTAILLGFVALACIGGLVGLRTVGQQLWPVPWPPLAVGLSGFLLALASSTWLVARLSRTLVGLSAAFLGLIAATSPMALAVIALPEHASVWRFAEAVVAAVIFLKGSSVLRTEGLGGKSSFRVASFLLLFPTLAFPEAFRADNTKMFLARHLPLMVVGSLRVGAGLLLAVGLFWVLFMGWGMGAWTPASFLGRIVALYLLVRGSLEYWTAYWRMVGCALESPFGSRPFGPQRPSNLWRAWDRPVHLWLLRHIYIPVGGRERPVIATLAAFGVSGLIACATVTPAVSQWPWEVMAFFGAQGLVVALEKAFTCEDGRVPAAVAWVGYTLSVAIFFGLAPGLATIIDQILL